METEDKKKKKIGCAFPMNGGDGAYSYTKNSQFQKEASLFAKLMFQEAIVQKLDVTETDVANTVRIADRGCSVGPNTFSAVDYLIEAAEDKYRSSSSSSSSLGVEFQVFFNDHGSNDFNTLFASLPPGRKYHAAGVPGSFHGRVFPRASITLAHSSYALHWLSRVPEGVLTKNKGRIFYAGESEGDVFDAYSRQFERDIGEFLRARAEEIVKGGLMFLMLPGIAEGVGHAHFPFATAFDLFHSSLKDLAVEGVIEDVEIEGFNFPVYYPSLREMTKVIEKNESFCIESVELTNPRSEISGHAIVLNLRASTEATFVQHFGESATEKMFSKALAKVGEASNSDMVEADLYHSAQLYYVLKRN